MDQKYKKGDLITCKIDTLPAGTIFKLGPSFKKRNATFGNDQILVKFIKEIGECYALCIDSGETWYGNSEVEWEIIRWGTDKI